MNGVGGADILQGRGRTARAGCEISAVARPVPAGRPFQLAGGSAMSFWPMTAVLLAVPAGAALLYGLHRLALWLEARGHL